jgi:hypothetical protein
LVEVDNRQKVRLGLRFSTHVTLTRYFHSRSNHERIFQQPGREAAGDKIHLSVHD